MTVYGSTSLIIARTGAEPETFGVGTEEQLEEILERLQKRASSLVEEYCDRVFDTVEGHVDVVQGTGRRGISTRNYPVLEVHEIRVGSSTIGADAYAVEEGTRPGRNAGRIIRTDGRPWPRGRDVTIEYDWGYTETPPVVDGVVEDMVVEAHEKTAVDRASDTKQSESMDGYSVTWDTSDVQDQLALTESMRERLRPLKRQGRA